MENKLTAVDFFKDKFIMIQWLLVRDEISRKQADEFLNKWYDKAKEMEKEQLIDFGRHGFTQGTIFGMSPIVYKPINSEQYYNETYGQ